MLKTQKVALSQSQRWTLQSGALQVFGARFEIIQTFLQTLQN